MATRDKVKILGVGLMALGGLMAALILTQMWVTHLPEAFVTRMIITIAITGLYGIYIAMVWDDADKSRHRTLLVSLGAFGGIATALILYQTWTEAIEWAMFVKILVSILILSGTVSFILAVREDFFDGKRLKDDDYID